MSRWKFSLPTAGFGAVSAALGALLHSVHVEGVASTTQFVGGSSLAAAAIAVFVAMYSAWKTAGGKFDGNMTVAEAKSLITAAATQLKLSGPVMTAAEQFARQAAALSNRAIKAVERDVPGATDLIATITKYLAEVPAGDAKSADHTAVLWKFLDVLSHEITGNVAGEDAAAKLREQFDLKLFPGTPAAGEILPLRAA